MAGTGLYVFGTSILWGQGHRPANKIHTQVLKRLRASSTVTPHFAPHSGAVVLGHSTAAHLHGEIPTPFPSIARQVRLAPRPTQNRVVVLVDGGINDVGVSNIINPLWSRAKLVRRTEEACHRDMTRLLRQIGAKYRGADIFVLGYYQILAARLAKHRLAALLTTLNVSDPFDLLHLDFVSKAVANCKLFHEESDRQLRRAVTNVQAGLTGSTTFVPSTFRPANGLFGRRPFLFMPGEKDPRLRTRLKECPAAIFDGRTGGQCVVASIGHPNQSGVDRYVDQLKRVLTPA